MDNVIMRSSLQLPVKKKSREWIESTSYRGWIRLHGWMKTYKYWFTYTTYTNKMSILFGIEKKKTLYKNFITKRV
jgi:hypothetical protein